MPFLPVVLLLAWQAVSKVASFVLGWATALYFGQVPGRQGRLLSVLSLLSAAWLILSVGFALPLLVGALADFLGLVPESFSVTPIVTAGLMAGILIAPPAMAAAAVWSEFLNERSVSQWLKIAPRSYLAVGALGLAVLEMVLITPWILIERLRAGRVLLELPVIPHRGTSDDDLVAAITTALNSQGIEEVSAAEASGIRSWPLRPLAVAARTLLGTVVRGEPVRLRAGEIEIHAYATNVAIHATKEAAYPIRAALERELALRVAYLTWSTSSQRWEDELSRARTEASRSSERLHERLDKVQAGFDADHMSSEEWNILQRLRLQVEHEAAEDGAAGAAEAAAEASRSAVSARR